MMNGTYHITLLTPIGAKRGDITFTDHNGALSGSIRAMGGIQNFKGGKTDGTAFEFSGILNTGLFNIRYTADGTAEGNALRGKVRTNLGTFQMQGEKA